MRLRDKELVIRRVNSLVIVVRNDILSNDLRKLRLFVTQQKHTKIKEKNIKKHDFLLSQPKFQIKDHLPI